MNDMQVEESGLPIFEQIKKVDADGNEYWLSRELSVVLGYSEYRHFLPVLEKAKEACRNSGQVVEEHFEDLLEMVKIGQNAQRGVKTVKLRRYA